MEPPPPPPEYPSAELPAFLDGSLPLDAKSRANDLVRQANDRLQRGQRYYQVKDLVNARTEFDSAVGLMLEAAGLNPDARDTYAPILDSMVDAIHRYDLEDLGAAAVDDETRFEKAPLEDILGLTFPVDPKLKDKVREQVAATVSQLPLTVNDAVLGYIHYFSGRGHGTIRYGLERAGRYRAMIERILDEEGVPRELLCLAQAESGFIPRALSRKAAGGMWQFLSWRGQEYGLMHTAYTDDRLDPEKATRAAARHLRDLYQEFGDWYLAMAAYDSGPLTVENAVQRTGYADFWELRNRGVLPIETTNYVPIILAMIIMEKNAAEYGLDNIAPDPPLEYDVAEMSSLTSLTLVSDILERPVPELAAMNPELLKGVAPAGYGLRIPKGSGDALGPALQLVPEERRNEWRVHRVASGESLASISQRFSVPASKILAANKLASAEPAEGDLLAIPAVPKPAAPATAKRASAKTTAAKSAPAAAAAKSATPAASKTASAPAKKSGAPVQAASVKQSAKPAPRTTASSGQAATKKAPSVAAQVGSN